MSRPDSETRSHRTQSLINIERQDSPAGRAGATDSSTATPTRWRRPQSTSRTLPEAQEAITRLQSIQTLPQQVAPTVPAATALLSALSVPPQCLCVEPLLPNPTISRQTRQ